MLSNVEASYKMQFGPDARDIRGMTILVVGDARGMGRMTSTLLADHGAKIFFAAPDAASLESVLESIRQIGGQADGMVLDLSQPGAVQRCFDAAARRCGPVQALVNTLTGEQTQMLANALDAKTRQEDLQNTFTEEVLMRLQGTAHAHIINIGQIKHDLPARSLAAALRQQAREMGIRVTMIEPGDAKNDCAVDVARCVLGSLVQPFGVDAIFLYEQGTQPVL